MGETARTAGRDALVASLFARHAQDVVRLVSVRVRAPYTVIEDACQTAWMRLLVHSEVDVEGPGAVRWVVVTATREAWRRSARRETAHRLVVAGEVSFATASSPNRPATPPIRSRLRSSASTPASYRTS